MVSDISCFFFFFLKQRKCVETHLLRLGSEVSWLLINEETMQRTELDMIPNDLIVDRQTCLFTSQHLTFSTKWLVLGKVLQTSPYQET